MKYNCYHCLYNESHRCSNQKSCPEGMRFEEYTGSTVKQCLCATTEVFQDGYIQCPILECTGCEKCMKQFGDGSDYQHLESQNYERLPDWHREGESEVSEELQEVVISDWSTFNPGDHQSIKTIIKNNINSVCANYVAIGYYLNVVNDKDYYKEDGYSGIGDYAAAEYGIDEDKCSYLRKIAKRFCIENSPALLPEYRDFKIQKLREMVYLTDEQLKQVTITTTRAEIREMKKPEPEKVAPAQVESEPEKVVPTSKQEAKLSYLECPLYDLKKLPGRGCSECLSEHNCNYDRTKYLEEIKRQEEWNIHCQVCKEMCDSICKNRSFMLEKNNYSMDVIKSVSRENLDFSFGFGNDGEGHSKYDAEYKAKTNQYRVKEFNGSGKWVFEAGEVDQQIWNYNGNTWRFKQHEAKKSETVNDTQESENKVETGLPCDTCGNDIQGCCDYPDTTDDYCVAGDKWKPKEEKVETVTADIVQIEPEKLPEPVFSAKYHLQEEIKSEEEQLEVMREYWKTNQPDTLLKHETILLALKCHLTDMEYPDPEVKIIHKYQVDPYKEKDIFEMVPHEINTAWSFFDKKDYDSADFYLFNARKDLWENEKYEFDRHEPFRPKFHEGKVKQPELSILKNNDQRKEFIDSYETWPIWIDQTETGERYYRYNLSDKVAMVVKVSRRHVYKGYTETKETDYTSPLYYLLGIKTNYSTKVTFTEDPTRTFTECSSNMTDMVNYLKEFQKKGA